MANFLNEIIESTIQPVKTNVLWIKNGVPYYYNKRWKPLLGGASGGTVDTPITFGEGEYSAILNYSNNNALGSRSIALGYNTTSYNNYEASFGKYNKSVKSEDLTKATLFSVGNGNATFPKNALEIKWDGSIYISGIDKSVQDYLGSIKTYDSEINDILKSLEELSDRITITDSKFEEFEEGINEELEEYYSKLTQIRNEVIEVTTVLDGKIETNKSSISQTAKEIRAEVSRVQTDLSGRIDTATSTISQTADAIRLEVEAVEGELNGKIEKNTSLINQTAESIELEVTNLSDHLKDVNSELAGLIAKNKAAIEINADEIKNKVSSDTFNAFSGEVQNQFTEVSTTVEGVKTSVQNIDGKLTEVNATVNGVTARLGTAEADIESLKKQSDGSIDTHFGTEAPTLNNEPAVNWVTDDLKNEHTGDIYYNNNTGEAYRFSYNPETNEYFWIELTDSALTDALDKISKLESAVDGKVTIFYTTPTNYKYGDMWFVHEDNASFKKGTLVSATNLDKGTIRATLVLADWKEEIEYVNFDELTEELTSLNDYIDNAFKDGVLSEAEIKHIQELKKNFQLSYKEINDLNSFLIITAFATEENKTALNNAKRALDTAFNELIDAIDNLNTELDDEGNNPSLALYNKKYQAYLKALDDYTEIAVFIQSEAEQELLKPSVYIKQISSDGYLTSIEKKQLIAVWKQIAEEFTANRGIAFNYKILKKEGNNYIDRTDIYDVDTGYHAIYNNYKNSYEAIAPIFIDEADPFGFKDLQNTTILSETTIESLASIEQLFDTYYANLALFSEMISKISNDITDAHQKVIDVTNALVDQLDPREAITQIGTGVVLSSVLGVKDIDGNLEAVLNGSDSIEEAQSTKHGNHGKIVFAGGINGSSKWDNATTIIYEDGHVVINSGEISDFVSIGNATFKNVVEAVTQFDVISSPHVNPNTGEIEYIPLFQVNRNDAGEIIYVSSVYDFVGNREISALGFNAGGGSSGGGLISKVYNVNNFGNITDTTNTATFNAYAIDSLYKRIVSLENKEVDLTGYATKTWVAGQGFITSAALSPYMKTADANDTFATKTTLNNLSSNHDSLAARVSTAEGNISANATAITNLGKRVTANEGNIAKILKWFTVDSDGNLCTTYNLYSTKEISANGLSIGSGGSGGGLISQVYGTTAFGTIDAESNSATFNAYAIDSLYKRIVSLEGKTTAVSFVPALTSGKQIGTLSIDGVSTVLYGVDAYSKTEADSTFLKLSGGTITTDSGYGLTINRTNAQSTLIAFKNQGTLKGFLGIGTSGAPLFLNGSAVSYNLLHSGNYNTYAPKLDGTGASGTWGIDISGTARYLKTSSFSAVNANELTYTNCALRYISALAGSSTNLPATTSYQNAILTLSLHDNGSTAQLYFTKGVENFYYRSQHTGDWKTVAFTDSNVASATKLATARTIWGQSFDGTKNVSGDLFLPNNKAIYAFASDNSNSFHVASLGSDDIMRYGYASKVSHLRGNSVHLLYGSSHTTGFVLNSSGNVTIGGSDLAGTSAKLYVNGKIVGATFVETEEYGIGNASYGLSSGLKGLALLALKGNIFMPFGNVGIGTYDPQYKLDVNGRIKSLYSSTNTILSNGVYSYNVNNGGFVLYAGVSSTNALRIEILDNTGAWKCGAMSFDYSGNVGIGTNAPEHKLHVSGHVAATTTNTVSRSFIASNANGAISLYTSTNRGVYDSTNSRWLIGTNGTNSFLLCGNVGIGTEAPVYKLDVNGSMNVVASDATARHIHVTNSVGKMSLHVAASGKRGLYDSTVDNWMIYTDSTSVYFPSKPLSITHAVTMDSTLAVKNILRVNDASMNAILNVTNEGGTINYVHLFVSSANSSNTTTRPLVLQNGYGNVGIGINNPQYKLHINGTARVGDTLSVAGLITANSGVKVASGQAITFLDASGKEHKLTYDSTAGAFKFDGNLYATGEVSGNGLHTN